MTLGRSFPRWRTKNMQALSMQSRRRFVLLTAAFLFFCFSAGQIASYGLALAGGNGSAVPGQFDTFSTRLVLDSLKNHATRGDDDLGGFMLAFDRKVHIASVLSIRPDMADRTTFPYISNFSLQYVFLKLLSPRDPAQAIYAVIAGSLVFNLCMAVIAGVFASRIREELSVASALGVIGLLAFSPNFGHMAGHVYWAAFLVWLPFTFMWLVYPSLTSMSKRLSGLAGVAILVFLKCLTGYEFVTNVAIGAAVPVVYFELKNNATIDRATLLSVIGRVVAVGAASVAGFAGAATLHVLKAAEFFGSFHDGLQALILPLKYSTVADTSIRALEITPASISSMISSYVQQPTILFFSLQAVLLTLAALSAIALINAKAHQSDPRGDPVWRKTRAFGLAAALASLGSLSWLLALKHAMIHLHIDWITLYAFMLPLLVPFTIFAVENYVLRRRPRPETAHTLGAV